MSDMNGLKEFGNVFTHVFTRQDQAEVFKSVVDDMFGESNNYVKGKTFTWVGVTFDRYTILINMVHAFLQGCKYGIELNQ